MRLFPGDEIPGLTAYLGEMRAPWILPPSFPPSHRRRLAVLVGRAARAFDPDLRFIELRWADRWLLLQGGLRFPPRVLVWWRVEPITDRAGEVIAEAPRLVPGHHLYDFDLDPGISSLGWLGPLKVRVLERITDVLLDEQPLNDPEPVLDALEDASRRLVSPIDLIDFAERLIAKRASGLGLEEARTEAIAAVFATRVEPEKGEQGAALRYVRALHAAAAGGPWSAEVHQDLLAAGLAEASPEVRPPVLEWLARPGVLERVEQRLRAGNSPSERPPAPVAEPAEAQAQDVSDVEAAAEAVLKEIRAGTDRQWSPDRKKGAALALLMYAQSLDRERGVEFNNVLLEREAVLYDTAGGLAEDASEPRIAVTALVRAAENYRVTGRLREAAQVVKRASDLAHREGDDSLRAMALHARGNLALRMSDLAEAKEAYEEAMPLYRRIGDPLGEANVLRAHGDLALRMSDVAEAKEAYEEALALHRRIGNRLGEANVLWASGYLAFQTADVAGAREAYEEALTLYQGIGDRLGEANVLQAMGDLALRMADVAGAKEAYEEALALYRGLGDRLGEANVLRSRADLALRIADIAGAKEAYEEALALYRGIGAPLGEANVLRGVGVLRLMSEECVPEELAESAALAESIQYSLGLWLSRTALAALTEPADMPTLEQAHTYFSTSGFSYEATLTAALQRLLAGDLTAARDLLRTLPAGDAIAATLAGLPPRAAVRRLLGHLLTN